MTVKVQTRELGKTDALIFNEKVTDCSCGNHKTTSTEPSVVNAVYSQKFMQIKTTRMNLKENMMFNTMMKKFNIININAIVVLSPSQKAQEFQFALTRDGHMINKKQVINLV